MYLQSTAARAVVACLAFILGLACSWFGGLLPGIETALIDSLMSTPVLAADSREPQLLDSARDVNSVYRAVVQKLRASGETKQIVIEAESTGCPMYESEKYRAEFNQGESFDSLVCKRLDSVEAETLTDYLQQNKEGRLLTGISDLGIASVVASADELNEAFREGWTSFYKKYPRSSGLIFFSNIGFNRDHTQAFVYAGRQCDGLCGSGQYVLLKKENGIWTVQQQMALWVS